MRFDPSIEVRRYKVAVTGPDDHVAAVRRRVCAQAVDWDVRMRVIADEPRYFEFAQDVAYEEQRKTLAMVARGSSAFSFLAVVRCVLDNRPRGGIVETHMFQDKMVYSADLEELEDGQRVPWGERGDRSVWQNALPANRKGV